MKLAFLSGPMAGDEVEVTDQIVIGRKETDVEIEDSAVSRQHARFTRTDDGLEVTDLESTNGTYVNGDRITGTRQLEPGDFVAVGATTIEVRGDWRSAQTEVIDVPKRAPDEDDPEDYVPTSPISSPPRVGAPANLRPLLIGAGAVGLILVIGLWFAFRGSDGFAAEVDEICRKAGKDVSDAGISGNNLSTLKPAARRLQNARSKVREDLADLEPEGDVAPRFGQFLQRYGTTNSALRRLATLKRKAKATQVRGIVDRIRDSAKKETEIANDLGFKVCGGLPV